MLNLPEYVGHNFNNSEETDDERLNRHIREALILLAPVKWGWSALADETRQYLADAFDSGAADALSSLAPVEESVTEAVKQAAQQYAAFRSAEMIGMQRTADGKLIQSMSAKWAISETTRKDILNSVVQALEEGWTTSQLAAVIEASTMFSSARADLIADTELRNAQSLAVYTLWQVSTQVQMVQWETSEEEGVCDICDEFEAQGEVPLGHEFAPGIRHPLAHPRCRCRLRAVKKKVVEG